MKKKLPINHADVLRLNEDIYSMAFALQLLDSVDHYNCHEDPEEGYKTLRKARAYVQECHRHAWNKMRTDYL